MRTSSSLRWISSIVSARTRSRNERSVRSASSEQVRQPISRDGLDHWKHFEPWLDPLKDALGDALTNYRD